MVVWRRCIVSTLSRELIPARSFRQTRELTDSCVDLCTSFLSHCAHGLGLTSALRELVCTGFLNSLHCLVSTVSHRISVSPTQHSRLFEDFPRRIWRKPLYVLSCGHIVLVVFIFWIYTNCQAVGIRQETYIVAIQDARKHLSTGRLSSLYQFRFLNLIFFCVYECFGQMSYICTMYVSGAIRGQKMALPGTGVRDGCKPPCVCWEPNSYSLQEQESLPPTHLSSTLY